ncbi:MAG: M56 family metallopeptidase [Oscillospiraceae bacterium]|nr:M56 family metallopeptidase [Oscillospiraceae bacterium]
MNQLIQIFLKVLDMSVVASIVILVVLAARLLLRKAPKIFSYVLWAVVLLRLLLPVTIPSPVSAIPAVSPVGHSQINDVLPDFEFETPSDRIQNQQALEQMEQSNGVVVTVSRSAEPTAYLTILWLAGMGIILLGSIISYLKIRRRLKVVIPLRENILIADDIQSPFVVGFVRPKIYLPSNLSEKERAYIILHEQYHIRRFDHIVKLLAFLALCLHWFNPLVWLAFSLASKDMEMSCDEAVVRKMGSGIRADYAASLLTLATGRRIIAGTPLAFGEGDPSGRIRNLSKWKKPAIWVMVIAVVLCAVLTVCLLTDPTDEDANNGMIWYSGTIVDSGMGDAIQADAEERAYITLQCGDENLTIWFSEGTEALEGVIGEYWVVRSMIDPDTGLHTMMSMYAPQPKHLTSLKEAIHQGILDHNDSRSHEGLCQTASFKELARDGNRNTVTVYGLAYHCVYALENGILREESGSHIPVALTFYITDSGEYVLTEYWQPRDGAYYADDIRAKFPLLVWPDTQAHIDNQIKECYAQAAAYFGVKTISSSAMANGFEIKLYADQDTYTTDDEIKIWATLEYQGAGDTITIWHGDPYLTFSLSDGGDFNSGGLVHDILTSTTLQKGEVYRFEYAKSGGYSVNDSDADFWESFYQDPQLHLPAGTYTVSVNGLFYLSPDQLPEEKGPSCQLQITITE